MILIDKLTKTFKSWEERLEIFRDLDLRIPDGAFVAIMGPSGSWKSTLLNLLSGLDTFDDGEMLVSGVDLHAMSEDERTKFRGRNVAFVFQSYHLVPSLTVTENIDLVLDINKGKRRFETSEIIEMVGLSSKAHKYPFQLSGGEQQRVGIARAFVMDTPYLFADEPTGNLDATNAEKIMDLLVSMHKKAKNTVLMITHDPKIAQKADTMYFLDNKTLVSSHGV